MRSIARVALFLLTMATVSNAQQYPNRPVQVLVGNGGGSAPDVAARLSFSKISATMGQSFVIVNRPGAVGAIAVQALTSAAPDGYTLLVASDSTFTSLPLVNKNAGVDPQQVVAIGPIAEIGSALLVNADLKVKSLDDFVALAKSKPGELNYSMFEAGQIGQLWMEALFLRLGIKVQHIPYKTGPELVQAAASGQVAITISSFTSAQGAIEAGKLIPIMFTGPRYPGEYGNVPHQSQLFPDLVDPTTAMGLFGPIGIPPEIVQSLNAHLANAVKSPEIFSALEKSGLTPIVGSAADFNASMNRKRAAYVEMLKQLAALSK